MSDTAIGYGALGKVISSEHNVAIGDFSIKMDIRRENHAVVEVKHFLFNKNGSANTGVGFNIFYENKESSRNVGLGFEAGYFSLGSKNIAIGYGAEILLITLR